MSELNHIPVDVDTYLRARDIFSDASTSDLGIFFEIVRTSSSDYIGQMQDDVLCDNEEAYCFCWLSPDFMSLEGSMGI